jgi:predicted Na+-dependent transporter
VFAVPEGPAIGLLLVGMASAGPLGVVAARIARADATVAVAAVGTLELANLVVIPAWSALLLPRAVSVPFAEIVAAVTLLLALPLLVGMVLRRRAPRAVPALRKTLEPVAAGGLLLAIALAFAQGWDALGNDMLPSVAGAGLVLVAACLAGGWLVAGDPRERRASGALVTTQRGNVVANTPEAALVISLFAAVVSLVVPAVALAFRWWQRDTVTSRGAKAQA